MRAFKRLNSIFKTTEELKIVYASCAKNSNRQKKMGVSRYVNFDYNADVWTSLF